MQSEVKPRFGFGGYSHITVYTHNKRPHTVHILIDILLYIYIYNHTYIDIQIYIVKGTREKSCCWIVSDDGQRMDLKYSNIQFNTGN